MKEFLDSEEFYNAMQSYRIASMDDQRNVIAHFEHVKSMILAKLNSAEPNPDRAELQAEGKHPAPCAKFCEATAFGIDIRTLKADRDKYKALCDQLGAAFESGSFIKTQMALAAWRAMK